MRTVRYLTLVLLIAVFGTLPTVLSAQDGAPPDTTPAATHHDVDIGLTFPATLAGLTYGGVNRYPQAALGYSVRYADDAVFADVYVYTGGEASIPSGHEAPVIQQQLHQAAREVVQVAGMGYYANLTGLTPGQPPTLHASHGFAWYQFGFNRVDQQTGQALEPAYTSTTALRGWNGRFIKIRFSSLRSTADHAALADRIMSELDGVLTATAAPEQP